MKKLAAYPSTSSPALSAKMPIIDVTNKNITIEDFIAFITNNLPDNYSVDPSGWAPLDAASLSVSSGYNKGNREFDLTTSASLATLLSEGMRLRIPRPGVVPTQCTDLETGSSQYWSKSSPSGMTFTDDFTVEAWVKLESYNDGTIASRFNGSSGWGFYVTSVGEVILFGQNSGGSNYSQIHSRQILPLNRWVHVAATLDMSGYTGSTPPSTSKIFIDGVDAAAYTERNGSNPTALIQAGNMQIGARNTTQFFDGKVADVRVWSAVRTATQIRDNMYNQLTGSETNLVGYWKLDGNGNDSTSNANNLTASGSATATTVDHPFSTYEYAIVLKVTGSVVTVLTPTGAGIPLDTLTGVSFSLVRSPFGFPSNNDRWDIDAYYDSSLTKGGASTSTWYNGGARLDIPLGNWRVGYEGNAIVQATATAGLEGSTSLSTSASSESDKRFTTMIPTTSVSTGQSQGPVSRNDIPVSLAVQTPYYLIQQAINGSGTINLFFCYVGTPGRIYAKCAYV